MFRAIRTANLSDLMALARQFASAGEHGCALMTYDHALRTPPPLQNTSLGDLLVILSQYWAYALHLRNVLSKSDLATGINVQQTLHFRAKTDSDAANATSESSTHSYIVERNSILYTRATERLSRSLNSNSDEDVVVPPGEIETVIKMTLTDRFTAMLATLDQNARNATVLQPCVEFAAGMCSRKHCRRNHSALDGRGNSTFTNRVRALALLMLILDGIPQTSGPFQPIGRPDVQR